MGVRGGTAADAIGVIEAAYTDEPEDGRWLRQFAELATRHLDQGLGGYAYLYDVSGGTVKCSGGIAVGIETPLVEAIGESIRLANSLSVELATRMYLCGPVLTTGSTQSGLGSAWTVHPAVTHIIERTGARDAVALATGDPSGVGCALQFPKREVGPVPPPVRAFWGRVAAHLAAAYRLRRHAGAALAPDAVLSPSGRLEHAEPAAQGIRARTELLEGARRMTTARGRLRRRDPQEAVQLWRALVAGRWSLVEHFDNDGRRFLVARRNEPNATPLPLRLLTPAERQTLGLAALGHPNKFIAYQLGISSSAVTTRLAKAAAKLGVRTRIELIEQARRSMHPRMPDSAGGEDD